MSAKVHLKISQGKDAGKVFDFTEHDTFVFGRVPYPFSKARDPIDVILNDDIVPLGQQQKTIPKNLCAVLDKALEKKTKDRYQTAVEMLAAMKKALP